MFEPVENCSHNDTMMIGIGSAEHKDALLGLGCARVFDADVVEVNMAQGIPLFRSDAADIAIVINPRLLSPVTIHRILDADVPIQVVGHEPLLPRTRAGREELRALRAKLPDGEKDPTAPGRPREINASDEAVEAAIKWWRSGEFVGAKWKSTYTPTAIVQKLRTEFGLDVGKHWARDQAFARFNSYKRNPNTKEQS